MRRLNKPIFDVKEIVCDCAESIRDKDKKERIQNAAEKIFEESEKYDSFASEHKISEIKEHSDVNGTVTTDEMVFLYKNKFVGKPEVKEKYYDKIMLLSNGKCPICDLGQVSNLDHYLPKSKYPTYAVTPYNLVPICRDCNIDKKDLSVTENELATFHPYYDEADSVIWLKAELKEENGGLIAVYSVNHEISDNTFLNRCENHIKTHGLEKRYCIESAREIADNYEDWKKCILTYGIEEYKFRINDKIKSFETIYNNSWKVALYRALLDNIDIVESVIAYH